MSEATDEMTSKIAKDSIEDSTVEGVRSLEADKYKYGFDSDIEQEFAPKGLNEDIVRFISEKKDEPQWLLDWRLEAYRRWLTLEEPEWAMSKNKKFWRVLKARRKWLWMRSLTLSLWSRRSKKNSPNMA